VWLGDSPACAFASLTNFPPAFIAAVLTAVNLTTSTARRADDETAGLFLSLR